MQLLLWVQYEDEDGDKVVLASDDYLAAAVDHARLAGWKARTRNTFSAAARTCWVSDGLS